jgi:hypothetical protein
MKKVFFTIALLFLFVTGIQAQGDFQFGVKAGFNVASLGGNAGFNYTPKPGFHAGVAVDVPFSDKLSVQPEVLVSLQGSGGFVFESLNFLYLNLPIMGKYNIWDKLHIEAGPQIGFLLSDNLEGNAFGDGEILFDESNGLDLGLALGAGYRLNDNFYFQLRYSAGIINAIKDQNSKNRVLQVSAIYFL